MKVRAIIYEGGRFIKPKDDIFQQNAGDKLNEVRDREIQCLNNKQSRLRYTTRLKKAKMKLKETKEPPQTTQQVPRQSTSQTTQQVPQQVPQQSTSQPPKRKRRKSYTAPQELNNQPVATRTRHRKPKTTKTTQSSAPIELSDDDGDGGVSTYKEYSEQLVITQGWTNSLMEDVTSKYLIKKKTIEILKASMDGVSTDLLEKEAIFIPYLDQGHWALFFVYMPKKSGPQKCVPR